MTHYDRLHSGSNGNGRATGVIDASATATATVVTATAATATYQQSTHTRDLLRRSPAPCRSEVGAGKCDNGVVAVTCSLLDVGVHRAVDGTQVRPGGCVRGAVIDSASTCSAGWSFVDVIVGNQTGRCSCQAVGVHVRRDQVHSGDIASVRVVDT